VFRPLVPLPDNMLHATNFMRRSRREPPESRGNFQGAVSVLQEAELGRDVLPGSPVIEYAASLIGLQWAYSGGAVLDVSENEGRSLMAHLKLLQLTLLLAILIVPYVSVHSNAAAANQAGKSNVAAPGLGGVSPSPVSPMNGVGASNNTGPTTGTIRVLVVAVEFYDVNHTKSIDQLKQAYFGTLSAYYSAVSYGTVSVQGDVVGWYRLPHPMVYYGRDCTSVDDSDCSGSLTSWWLARDAVNLANKDPNVNFNNYDYFVFLHSGVGEESSHNKDTVWSVAYLSGIWLQTKVKSVNSFDIVPESEDQGAIPYGVYTHEFGHLLGLPDLYNTMNGKTKNGPWELMDKGLWNGDPPGSMPAEMSAWDRIRLGWIQTSQISTLTPDSSDFTILNPLERPNGGIAAVKVQINSNQYYMLEDRRPIGFDVGLPNYGIVTYAVDSSHSGVSVSKVGDISKAFGVGYLFQGTSSVFQRSASQSSALVNFKVFASFANGSYLVGFGQNSFIKTATLTVSLNPAVFNATVMVNGQAYLTDENGTVTVLDYSGNPTGFNITALDTVPAGLGIRGKFAGWSTGATSNKLALLGENVTISALYKTQYYVSIASEYGTPDGVGWYDVQSNATISIQSPINATQQGVRYMFTEWSGDYNGTRNPIALQVNQPLNLTASWKTQFYFAVDTGGHAVSTGTGWYDNGTVVNYRIMPPQPSNGTWYIFNGWSGDYSGSSLSGTVTLSKPVTISAAWATLDWVTFQFLDASYNPVQSGRISEVQLTAPNGTTVPVNASTGQWLQRGSYQVASVHVFGIDVASRSQSFTTQPKGHPKIYLNLFQLTFNTHDRITTSTVSNVNVTITLPDRTYASAVTGQDGKAVFDQLPSASYQYKIAGGWVLQSSGTVHVADDDSNVNIQLVFLPTLTAVVGGLTFTAITVFLIVKRSSLTDPILVQSRRRAKRLRTRSSLPNASVEKRVYEYIVLHRGVISKSKAAAELGISKDTLTAILEHMKNHRRVGVEH
jgi:M6 family metalloprotease-like protein